MDFFGGRTLVLTLPKLYAKEGGDQRLFCKFKTRKERAVGKKADGRRGYRRRQKQPAVSQGRPSQWRGRLHRLVRAGKGVFRFAVTHWRRIAVVFVLINLGVLGVWYARQIALPVGEAPVPSPTQLVPGPTEGIPLTETPVAEATSTPAEISPTKEVGSPQGIPDSVLPGGFRSPWDVVLLFNGNDEELTATGADGCPIAFRGYMESFYGSSLPLWEEMGAVSELPELPEGVILRVGEPIYKLRTLEGEEGWLVPGWAALSSQIACRQKDDGAEVYINNRPAKDQAVWVVIWGEAHHAAIFRVVCGNFALVKGTLPPPEKEVTPTPTVSPTGTPTATPTRSPTPSPSVTPSPTPTSTPVTPTPTVTPSPTATGTPVPTVTPTSTPRPTSTPQPTPTWTPTATPAPTSTPVPTATQVPTNTPTPRPTATPQPTPTEEPPTPMPVLPTPTAVPPTPTPVPPTPTPTPTSGPRPTATPQG